MTNQKQTPEPNTAHARSAFSGKLGYVLSTAASAIGLGNIWRFPYLAAKYGGGIFLLVYLILVLTFGYTLIVSETAIGRMTRKSPIGAFTFFGKKRALRFGGWINAVIPMLIVPYYSVIGGWVIKYLFEYLKGSTVQLAGDQYFSSFISNGGPVEFWFIVFSLMTLVVVLAGVKSGVELVSKIMMPLLIILAVIVAVYSCTRPGAMAGIKYFLIPNFSNFSFMTIVAAMGQMFYSLSCAMGILYTYGSYVKKDVNIESSTNQVAFFDTLIAVLAGLMIIPAVFAFSSGTPEHLNAGPSLMFVTIPKVFANMGLGRPAGILFFLLVLLAALTSSISLAETSVSTLEDELNFGRRKATVLFGLFMIVIGSLSVLGYSVFDFVRILGMQILDFFDFLTNSVMMPIAALATCLLVSREVGIKRIAEEMELSSGFHRKKLYQFMVRFVAPIFLLIILVSSVLDVFGIISM